MDRGHYPESLEELVKAAYLDHLPRDYYSKEDSLIYKRTDGDFLPYSRGLDFEDNGGKPAGGARGPRGRPGLLACDGRGLSGHTLLRRGTHGFLPRCDSVIC